MRPENEGKNRVYILKIILCWVTGFRKRNKRRDKSIMGPHKQISFLPWVPF